jgi:hypothetical protein
MIVVTAVVVVLAGYAAVAPSLGYEWPYPQRLPVHFERGRWTFDRDDGCHSRDWWYRTQQTQRTFTRVDSLTSAIGVGGSPVYAWSFEGAPGGDYTTLFVQRSSGCFTAYANHDAGG